MSVVKTLHFDLGGIYEKSVCNSCFRAAGFVDVKAGNCIIYDYDKEILCRKCRDVIAYSDYTIRRQIKEYLRKHKKFNKVICIAISTGRIDRILANKDKYDYDICFDTKTEYDSRDDELFEKISGVNLSNCVIYEYDRASAFDECIRRINECPRYCAFLQLGTIYTVKWIKTDHGLIMKLILDTESG